jgi:CRP-like cAMP-binding protein/multidrug efflux pump subunit AcrA (membrane-fusion protein)
VLAFRLDTATTRERGGGCTEKTMLEFVGYVAAGLVFATFYMKTMIPLRVVGISSNVTFLLYSWFAGVMPLFVLHAALLPLNIWRLMQIRALVREVRKVAVGDLPLESLLPFMSPRRAEAGEVLFRRGDAAGEMFHLMSGAVRLEELGKTLGPGAMLGEISMFAPRRERTATAVCDTDVELLSITADKVMQLYYQNPRFGFHVIRLITGRLIENLRRGEPVWASDADPSSDQEPPEGGPVTGAERPASMLTAELRARVRRRRLIGLYGGVAAAITLLAAGWQLGPYLRSTVSRDSAVTSWIHVATSPIAGNLDSRLPKPGDRVGPDGVIVTVRNRHNDPSAAEQSEGEVARAEAIVEELGRYVDAMRQLDAEWQARTASHAAAFKENLEVTLTSARLELEQVEQRLAIARAELDRMQRLAARGNASVAAADEALGSVAELELERVERERSIAELEVRRAAAERGIFMTSDGTDPDWNDRRRDQLRHDIARGVADLAEAEATLANARHVAATDASALERTSAGAVSAPPGSLIWSVMVGAGTAVNIGSPIAEWLDCSVMLVDVPASDIEVALVRPGMEAEVVLEGEQQPRQATILLTRGSAGTLGLDALAALAKGRSAGRGQVLLRLEPTPEDVAACPIGLSAFVEFPQVDGIDMLRARLRL